MFTVFIMPMLLRPVDFLNNVQGYVVGVLTYILLLPTFTNIMQIYAMCNLHDISWGNRPTVAAGSSGTNAFAENEKKQALLRKDYEVFRVNFFCFWCIVNGAYIVFIDSVVNEQYTKVNDGSFHFLEIVSVVFAGIVVYKVFFCLAHLIRFKIRISCYDDLKVGEVDLDAEVERLK